MRVAVEKIPGVEDVTVSLNEGMTVVRFSRVNRVTVSQVRRAIREKGFTPKDAEVHVRGRIEQRGDTFVLILPESGPVYTMRVPPSLRTSMLEMIGRDAQIEGGVAQDGADGETPAIIEVMSVRSDPG